MNRQEQMYALISEYSQSGLSLKAFCEQKGIKLPTFQYWRKKQKETNSSAFLPIKTAGNIIADGEGIEIAFPNGVAVRLNHFDLNQINQLLNLA